MEPQQFVNSPRRRNRGSQEPTSQTAIILVVAAVLLLCVGFAGWRLMSGLFSGSAEETPQAVETAGGGPTQDLTNLDPLLALAATGTSLAGGVYEGPLPAAPVTPEATGGETPVVSVEPGTPLPPAEATLAAFYQGVAATQTALVAPPTETPTATALPPMCIYRVGDGDFLAGILDEFGLSFEEGTPYYKYTACEAGESSVSCTGRTLIDEKFSLDVGEWVEIPDPEMTADKCAKGDGRMTY